MQEQVRALVEKMHNFRVLFGDEVTHIFLSEMIEALEKDLSFLPQGITQDDDSA